MSLTSALNIAQSALFNASRQTNIVSRNVAEASNPDYTRRAGVLSSTAPGARISEIRRATDDALFKQNLSALSSWQGQSRISQGLDRLRLEVNGTDNATSPASALGKLQTALQNYAAAPSNRTLAETAVEAARGMVRSLNNGTEAVQSFRTELDADIATSVGELNELLAQFEAANTEVIRGTRAGRDVSDALDRRDALLKKISGYVPVSTISRADNDLVVTTADGTTLFETVPRAITFARTDAFAPGMTGNAVYIDGVPLASGTGGNTTASGSLAASLQLRDQVAVDMQRQLDETARGLITAFAESDPAGTGADMAGLFTWNGGPGLPASGALVDGLAGRIGINANVDAAAGGDPERLRDGIVYDHNPDDAASFSDLLDSYIAGLDEPMVFDPAASLGTTKSLNAFTSESIGWLEGLRKEASGGAQAKEALAMHTATALSNATGVNIDEEMALLLELERSYEASAKLMSVVDEMLSQLMQVAR
ncbi:flagellar hook-associated protein FlgK [Chelativorans sp. M5D2P16]|uniref:flagellar hook-associated protein FlgK n=1 Tax=Chelativorans sp. M5D2P16 TaxID=3095678 RepID=UPI002ACA8379|nr:flagellar hook-associated protein FlgK [Chelativorans sp. M5D2P16]MDZ5698459.1 flagellar hook-associated protein FlgK [Chelativorans sp. M5D2P16]